MTKSEHGSCKRMSAVVGKLPPLWQHSSRVIACHTQHDDPTRVPLVGQETGALACFCLCQLPDELHSFLAPPPARFQLPPHEKTMRRRHQLWVPGGQQCDVDTASGLRPRCGRRSRGEHEPQDRIAPDARPCLPTRQGGGLSHRGVPVHWASGKKGKSVLWICGRVDNTTPALWKSETASPPGLRLDANQHRPPVGVSNGGCPTLPTVWPFRQDRVRGSDVVAWPSRSSAQVGRHQNP